MSSTRVTPPTATPQPPAIAVTPVVAQPMNPLLAAYLARLAANPLRTKQITSGTFSFVQDILANHIAGVPSKKVHKDAPFYEHLLAAAKVDARAFKMAVYGYFVSAPLNHIIVGRIQRAFAGQTGTRAKIMQILASNLIQAPIMVTAYLVSVAIINGARTSGQIIRFIKAGFWMALRVNWIVSPVSIAIAQNYLSPELWVPFFNLVQFITGTIFNVRTKKMQLAAARQHSEKGRSEDK